MPNIKKFRLSGADLDEISLCPAGDNPLATVVLSKADDSQTPPPEPEKKPTKKSVFNRVMDFLYNMEDEETAETQKDDTVVPANRPSVEDTKMTMKQLSKEDLAALSEEGRQVVMYLLEKAENDEVDDAIDDFEEVEAEQALEKADPAIRALVEKAKEEAKAAKDSVAVVSKTLGDLIEKQQKEEAQTLAKSLPHIAEDPENLANTLLALRKTDPTQAEKVEKMLRDANQALSESNLFVEMGRPGGVVTVSKSVENAVEEMIKNDPTMTREQAIAQVYDAHPELYENEIEGR